VGPLVVILGVFGALCLAESFAEKWHVKHNVTKCNSIQNARDCVSWERNVVNEMEHGMRTVADATGQDIDSHPNGSHHYPTEEPTAPGDSAFGIFNI